MLCCFVGLFALLVWKYLVVVNLMNVIFFVIAAGPSNREDSSQPPGELCEILCHAIFGQNPREEAHRDQGERQVLYDVSGGSSVT